MHSINVWNFMKFLKLSSMAARVFLHVCKPNVFFLFQIQAGMGGAISPLTIYIDMKTEGGFWKPLRKNTCPSPPAISNMVKVSLMKIFALQIKYMSYSLICYWTLYQTYQFQLRLQIFEINRKFYYFNLNLLFYLQTIQTSQTSMGNGQLY